MNKPDRILVAPLNWGLGHATRCIPIIDALLEAGFEVIIGSDGEALQLLQWQFPELKHIELPAYNVEYPEDGNQFMRKLLSQSPQIWRSIRREHKLLKKLITTHNITGIISDNRLGLYTSQVPCTIITHQLTVLSGKTTRFSSFLHRRFLKKFDECWIPDFKGDDNMSGLLSHHTKSGLNLKHIGPLSRMSAYVAPATYKATAILSGPEPQRTLLEERLTHELKKYSGPVLIVRGVLSDEEPTWRSHGNITTVDYLTASTLEHVINKSSFIIARSGYTTVMDLASMGKRAFFIPTPGQPEQEYLASRLQERGMVPYCSQENFTIKQLAKVQVYKGFEEVALRLQQEQMELRDFFGLFKGERKFRSHSKFTFNIDFFFMRLHDVFYNRQA